MHAVRMFAELEGFKNSKMNHIAVSSALHDVYKFNSRSSCWGSFATQDEIPHFQLRHSGACLQHDHSKGVNRSTLSVRISESGSLE
jgi:hypothetical protein